MEVKNRHVLVLGLGVSGRAAAAFLLKKRAHVCGIDTHLTELDTRGHLTTLLKNGMRIHDLYSPLDLHQFNLVIVSPGISKSDPIYQSAIKAGIEIIGEMELACRFITQKVIAITGTNGKTTTTLLTEHVLNLCGKPARALGNIGIPLIEQVNREDIDSDEILVVELSSYQLETLQSKVVDAGVILNITPDHLDRYQSMDEYALAKIRLRDCMKIKKNLVVQEACFEHFRSLFKEDELMTFGYSERCSLFCNFESVFFNGKKEWDLPVEYRGRAYHDIENWMAAFALTHAMGVTGTQFKQAADSFTKPAHRMEFVRTFKGVDFIDDSKGTNLDAVIKAVHSVNKEIILIAGGVDKGASYKPWIKEFAGCVKKVFAIGQAAEKIKNDLSPAIPVDLSGTLDEALSRAVGNAQEGQVILLSPGCASFDQFKDYVHRGEEFKRLINNL